MKDFTDYGSYSGMATKDFQVFGTDILGMVVYALVMIPFMVLMIEVIVAAPLWAVKLATPEITPEEWAQYRLEMEEKEDYR